MSQRVRTRCVGQSPTRTCQRDRRRKRPPTSHRHMDHPPSPHKNRDEDRSPTAPPRTAQPPIRPVRRTGQRRSVRRIVGWCQI